MGQLQLSGTPTFNGDGTCTINSTGSDIVRAPSGSLSPVQMWAACRVKVAFASTDTTNRRFFTWGADTNNELFLEWSTGSTCSVGRDAGGSLTAVGQVPGAFSAGSDHTFVGAWDSGLVKASFDGAALSTAANAGNPPVPALFDIGVRGYTPANWIESDVYWFAAGVGLLSDADAATLHGFGNTDPLFGDLPANAIFLWTADDVNTQPMDVSPRFNAIPFMGGH